MFDFEIKYASKECAARTGILKTPHGEIRTPVFMPVGTKATVKSLEPDDLENLGAEIILANTYHLAMRPGEDLVKKMGGLHEWTRWNKPMLTDSGGFQVFSLKDMRKIDEDGVTFQSHLDGSTHRFTPEKVIEIEEALGADIIMPLDECSPGTATYEEAKIALRRTHNWVERSFKAKIRADQALFPIVQGNRFQDLREESAKFMAQLDSVGIAIGGVSVGEELEQKFRSIDWVMPHLPPTKPRYLMGVGTPDDLLNSIERGVDMFDCVLPTRLARHGAFWDFDGRHDIGNTCYRDDPTPIYKTFSKSYVHHLCREKEILGYRILSLHNLAFLFHLMDEIRYNIEAGSFLAFKADFLARFLHKK